MAQVALKTVLENIAQQLQALDDTLKKEFTALSENDVDGIRNTAGLKNTIFEQLETHELSRCKILQDASLDPGSRGVKTYMLRHINDPRQRSEIAQLWQEIENLTQTCRRNNQINGIILEKSRQRTERALALLKGYSPDATATATYNASGKTTVTQQSHNFLKA